VRQHGTTGEAPIERFRRAGFRHRSATETPASCSFKIPMICSSENRLRLLWSLSWARANFNLD
jgi:hypothetical protein